MITRKLLSVGITFVFLIVMFGCGDGNPVGSSAVEDLDNNTKLENPGSGSLVDEVTDNPSEDIDPEELARLGLISQKAGFPKEARALFIKALEIDKDNYTALTGLAFLDIELKDYDTALSRLERVYQTRLDDPRIHEGLAKAYAELNKGDKAEFHYMLALSLYQKDSPQEAVRLEEELSGVIEVKKLMWEILSIPQNTETNIPSIARTKILIKEAKALNVADNDLKAELLFACAEAWSRLYLDGRAYMVLEQEILPLIAKDILISWIKSSEHISLDYNPTRNMIGLPIDKEFKLIRTSLPEGLTANKKILYIVCMSFNQPIDRLNSNTEMTVEPKPSITIDPWVRESSIDLYIFVQEIGGAKKPYTLRVKNLISQETGESIDFSFSFFLGSQ